MKWESKLAWVTGAAWIIMLVLVALHWWQDSLMEDGAWIWLCHSMGDQQCATGEPPVVIRIGGMD